MFFRLLLLAASFSAFANDPEKVHFRNKGDSISGELYWPKTTPPKGGFPAVVWIGPASSVKNQIVHLYGEKLALKGFVALTFDPRTFGESEGQPRQMEVPDEKVSDFMTAVQFLSTRPGVNVDRIHSMGVCCGANVALKATTMDRRIRSLAYVSSCPASEPMWRMLFSDRFVDAKLVRSAAAQTAFTIGNGVNYISATEKGSGLFHSLLTDFRAADYFLSPRGYSPYWSNQIATMSLQDFLRFESRSLLPKLKVPTIFILAQDDARYCPNLFPGIASVAAPKNAIWIPGTGRTDFYDNKKVIDQAVSQMVSWFEDISL